MGQKSTLELTKFIPFSYLVSPASCLCTYRVIQEESAILWEMTVCVILSKKVHMNMGPILDGYGVMGIY